MVVLRGERRVNGGWRSWIAFVRSHQRGEELEGVQALELEKHQYDICYRCFSRMLHADVVCNQHVERLGRDQRLMDRMVVVLSGKCCSPPACSACHNVSPTGPTDSLSLSFSLAMYINLYFLFILVYSVVSLFSKKNLKNLSFHSFYVRRTHILRTLPYIFVSHLSCLYTGDSCLHPLLVRAPPRFPPMSPAESTNRIEAGRITLRRPGECGGRGGGLKGGSCCGESPPGPWHHDHAEPWRGVRARSRRRRRAPRGPSTDSQAGPLQLRGEKEINPRNCEVKRTARYLLFVRFRNLSKTYIFCKFSLVFE